MRPKKIYLISPREPSGATWLINCLIELGIKTYRATLGEMWESSERGEYTLNPVENRLKKWLPILSERKHFQFRSDVEVEWAHHWPTSRHSAHCIIYFVRDPRDALFSRYRREAPEMTFREFLNFPDPYTMRDKIDTWNLFNEVWLQQPNLRFFRFEDYKQDAGRTLRNILLYAEIAAEEQEIVGALGNSSFEKATAAERRYREQHPEDKELINRSSQVGAWQSLAEAGDVARIVEGTRGLLAYFGYDQQPHSERKNYMPHAGMLDFYKRLPVSPDFWQPAGGVKDISADTAQVVQFVLSLDEETLRRSGISAYDIFVLLQGIEEFMQGVENLGAWKIQNLRKRCSTKPWWTVVYALDRHHIRLPRIVRVWQWRIYRFFQKFMVGDSL